MPRLTNHICHTKLPYTPMALQEETPAPEATALYYYRANTAKNYPRVTSAQQTTAWNYWL